MIQVTVRQFRNGLAKYLKVPCQVLSHGVPIASIIPVGATDAAKFSEKTWKKVEKVEAPIPPKLSPIKEADQFYGEPSGWKKIWFDGKQYWVDELGNDKGEVK